MGADGHIGILDADRVRQIEREVREKYALDEDDYTFGFRGYFCDWTCNGKAAAVVYWGDNAAWCGWGIEDSQLDPYGSNPEAQKEFAKRLAAEATIVSDEEVWT